MADDKPDKMESLPMLGGLVAGAALLIATIGAVTVVAISPELSTAWRHVSAMCGQSSGAPDCIGLIRSVNALRARVVLMTESLAFGGIISALGCVLIGAGSTTARGAGGRHDFRRVSQTIPLLLVAIGGVVTIGGLFVSTYIR